MNNGWIKLYRKIQESDMYQYLNSKQRDVMIQILLMANHHEREWMWEGRVYKCKPGQLITSLQTLKSRCAKDVSIQNIRTSLSVLEKFGFLTNKSTNTGRIITLINWDAYQSDEFETNKETNKELTNDQQTANKQLTTNKNDKNDKNVKNIKYIYSRERKEIIDYLNEKTGQKYRYNTKKTVSCINARLNEGFTLDDFIIVIDKKYREWRNTEYEKFVRPETLFGSKFEGYLNQKINKKRNINPAIEHLIFDDED